MRQGGSYRIGENGECKLVERTGMPPAATLPAAAEAGGSKPSTAQSKSRKSTEETTK
jgi:hypothetical protein